MQSLPGVALNIICIQRRRRVRIGRVKAEGGKEAGSSDLGEGKVELRIDKERGKSA